MALSSVMKTSAVATQQVRPNLSRSGVAGAGTDSYKPFWHLHRAIGNRAMAQLLQTDLSGHVQPGPKLQVSSPNDASEREADSVALHVMNMSEARPEISNSNGNNRIHRLCAECEEEKKVQRKSATDTGMGSLGFEADLFSLKNKPGQALPADVRKKFEPRFGVDFSGVRIHTDRMSQESSGLLNARAFTLGTDIAFAAGQYSPNTSAGQQLLAHELTHVVQQSNPARSHVSNGYSNSTAQTSSVAISSQPGTTVQGDFLEYGSDIALGLLDPKILIGTMWLKMPRPAKAKFIDKAVNGVLSILDDIPGKAAFGEMWIFIKEGFRGFFENLKTAKEDLKIQVIDKIAMIWAGQSLDYALAMLKGLVKGFFVDGMFGIFIALWELLKVLRKLWDFIKGIAEAIGNFPEEIQKLVDGFIQLGDEIVNSFGSALEELEKLILNPDQMSSLLNTIVEKGKGYAKQGGGKIADALLQYFSKPGVEAELGETAGRITGMVLWEALFAVLTSGGGLTVTAAKEALNGAVKILGKLVGKVVGAILKIVEEIRAAFKIVADAVKAAINFVKGKLKQLGGKIAELLEGIVEFFANLLRNCHESKLTCKFVPSFKKVVAILRRVNKAAPMAMKEISSKIHSLRELAGQAVAVVEVKVDGVIRYVAAPNSGAGWTKLQKEALKDIGVDALKPFGKEVVHAEGNIEFWVKTMRGSGKKVDVLRWGISAGEGGKYICTGCRAIAKNLGGIIEEF